jgi:hypothetical protein
MHCFLSLAPSTVSHCSVFGKIGTHPAVSPSLKQLGPVYDFPKSTITQAGASLASSCAVVVVVVADAPAIKHYLHSDQMHE